MIAAAVSRLPVRLIDAAAVAVVGFMVLAGANPALSADTPIPSRSARSFHAELRAVVPATAEAPNVDSDPSSPEGPQTGISFGDPLERVNRTVHEINIGIVRHVLEPTADFVEANASAGVRRGFSNMMANLREPVSAGSALVEGSYGAAGQSAWRFLLNSTVGVLGYRDVAAEMGYEGAPRTLGMALCRRGVPSGPYVVMPLFGPSTVRDTGTWATTTYVQYLILGTAIIPYRALDVLATYMDSREQLKELDDMALDDYVRYKSAYGQVLTQKCSQHLQRGLLPLPG